MSVYVEAVAWSWWCADCCAGGEYRDEGLAFKRADEHNRENHQPGDLSGDGE